ncbi:unnamed protein product [Rangifer tarandus platyrhynchus]|uniref:Uncharacterized protein n=1 Tax=Rangifer tarandus platyrhynchus TaxID=3082113 RepID=A0AC59ZGR2_RANTA
MASGCQNQKAQSTFLRKINRLLAVRYHISTPLKSLPTSPVPSRQPQLKHEASPGAHGIADIRDTRVPPTFKLTSQETCISRVLPTQNHSELTDRTDCTSFLLKNTP